MKFKILLASVLTVVVASPAIASSLTPRSILPQLPERFCEGVRTETGQGYYEFIDSLRISEMHACKWKKQVRRSQLHICGYTGFDKIECGR